jgi:hypothetical protein
MKTLEHKHTKCDGCEFYIGMSDGRGLCFYMDENRTTPPEDCSFLCDAPEHIWNFEGYPTQGAIK